MIKTIKIIVLLRFYYFFVWFILPSNKSNYFNFSNWIIPKQINNIYVDVMQLTFKFTCSLFLSLCMRFSFAVGFRYVFMCSIYAPAAYVHSDIVCLVAHIYNHTIIQLTACIVLNTVYGIRTYDTCTQTHACIDIEESSLYNTTPEACLHLY